MAKLERLLIYPVLAVLCAAVFGRLPRSEADPLGGKFSDIKARTITASALEIVDDKGERRARIFLEKPEGAAAGQPERAYLEVIASDGRARLGAFGNGDLGLYFRDKAGKVRARFGLVGIMSAFGPGTGEPWLQLSDAQGKPTSELR